MSLCSFSLFWLIGSFWHICVLVGVTIPKYTHIASVPNNNTDQKTKKYRIPRLSPGYPQLQIWKSVLVCKYIAQHQKYLQDFDRAYNANYERHSV
jgi:hypothetical protein